MEGDWLGNDWDGGLDPNAAGEIQDAIDVAAGTPIPEAGSSLDGPNDPGWGGSTGWEAAGEIADSLPASGGHEISEEEAAALLVELMSNSAVNTEDGRLVIEPDSREFSRWNEQKKQDARDIMEVVGQPGKAPLILEALELERSRLDTLIAEHDQALEQQGYDRENPEVAELAQQIDELHTRIEELQEEYRTLVGFNAPNPRHGIPDM